jgi:putative flippase GtrA
MRHSDTGRRISPRLRTHPGSAPAILACSGTPRRSPVQSAGVSLVETVRLRLGTTWRLLLKELSAFGIVGVAAFAIDILIFQLLYAHVGLGAVTAKTLATLVSMTVAYFAHRYWSFSHRARTGLRREYLLFVVVNGATLLLNVGAVAFVRYSLGQESALVLQVANVLSIAVGTVIRYLSYRRWVFPAHQPHVEPVAAEALGSPPTSATSRTA